MWNDRPIGRMIEIAGPGQLPAKQRRQADEVVGEEVEVLEDEQHGAGCDDAGDQQRDVARFRCVRSSQIPAK